MHTYLPVAWFFYRAPSTRFSRRGPRSKELSYRRHAAQHLLLSAGTSFAVGYANDGGALDKDMEREEIKTVRKARFRRAVQTTSSYTFGSKKLFWFFSGGS